MGWGLGGNRRDQEMLVQREDENKRLALICPILPFNCGFARVLLRPHRSPLVLNVNGPREQGMLIEKKVNPHLLNLTI